MNSDDFAATGAVGQRYSVIPPPWTEGPLWTLSREPLATGRIRASGGQATWVNFYAQLTIVIGDPTAEEVEDATNAPVEFALVPGEHALVLAYRFGASGPWSDGSWQACRQDPDLVGLPQADAGDHLGVIITMVDLATNIVRVRRAISWPARFWNAVRDAIATQVANHSDNAAGVAEITDWTRRHPTPGHLVDAEATIRTSGGGTEP